MADDLPQQTVQGDPIDHVTIRRERFTWDDAGPLKPITQDAAKDADEDAEPEG